jgi:DNA-binding GntR family transcriptional regulator
MAPMHTQSREPRAGDGPRLERAIVLQLLRDDREPRWSHEALLAELGVGEPVLEAALGRLDAEGVLCMSPDEVWASRAARRLDELELIGI